MELLEQGRFSASVTAPGPVPNVPTHAKLVRLILVDVCRHRRRLLESSCAVTDETLVQGRPEAGRPTRAGRSSYSAWYESGARSLDRCVTPGRTGNKIHRLDQPTLPGLWAISIQNITTVILVDNHALPVHDGHAYGSRRPRSPSHGGMASPRCPPGRGELLRLPPLTGRRRTPQRPRRCICERHGQVLATPSGPRRLPHRLQRLHLRHQLRCAVTVVLVAIHRAAGARAAGARAAASLNRRPAGLEAATDLHRVLQP